MGRRMFSSNLTVSLLNIAGPAAQRDRTVPPCLYGVPWQVASRFTSNEPTSISPDES